MGARLRLGLALLAVAGIALLVLGRARRSSPLPVADPVPPPADDLDALTRDELYERARAADVPGRSKMNKAQLRDALRGF